MKAIIATFFCSVSLVCAAAPQILYIYPAGGCRGSEFEVTVGGLNLDSIESAICGADGVSAELIKVAPYPKVRLVAAKKRNDVTGLQQATFKVVIDSSVDLGCYDFRVAGTDGISNRQRFFINSLREVNESPGNTVKQPQKLGSLPILVNGQVLEGQEDAFNFPAQKGQQLLIQVEARAIIPYLADAVPGWFQARLNLYNESGRCIAQSDDYYFDPDPVLLWTVPEDGNYTASIKDSIYRGRDDFVYRLRIGELPWISSIYPLGRPTGSKTKFELQGINLKQKTVQAKDGESMICVEQGGYRSNARPVAEDNLPEVDESALVKGSVTLPVVINGRISQPGETDLFHFENVGPLEIEVLSRRLGAPLDARIELQDEKGKVLGSSDDEEDISTGYITHHADPAISSKAKGTLSLRISDAQGKGGGDFAYRIRIAPPKKDFELRIMPDVLSIPRGGYAAIKARAIRSGGFNGPIDLSVDGLPEGASCSGARIPAGQDELSFTLQMPEKCPDQTFVPRWSGTAEIDGREVTHDAPCSEDRMQAFIYHHYLPADEGLIRPLEESSFSIEIVQPEGETIEIAVGKEIEIPIRVVRKPEKPQPENKKKGKKKRKPARKVIVLALDQAPAGMTFRAPSIKPDQTEGVIKIRVRGNAAGISGNLIVTGTLKVGKKNLETVTAPARPFKVPGRIKRQKGKPVKPTAKDKKPNT